MVGLASARGEPTPPLADEGRQDGGGKEAAEAGNVTTEDSNEKVQRGSEKTEKQEEEVESADDNDDDDDGDEENEENEERAYVDANVFCGVGLEMAPNSGGPPLDLPRTLARFGLDERARPYDARVGAVLVPYGMEHANRALRWQGSRWNRPTAHAQQQQQQRQQQRQRRWRE